MKNILLYISVIILLFIIFYNVNKKETFNDNKMLNEIDKNKNYLLNNFYKIKKNDNNNIYLMKAYSTADIDKNNFVDNLEIIDKLNTINNVKNYESNNLSNKKNLHLFNSSPSDYNLKINNIESNNFINLQNPSPAPEPVLVPESNNFLSNYKSYELYNLLNRNNLILHNKEYIDYNSIDYNSIESTNLINLDDRAPCPELDNLFANYKSNETINSKLNIEHMKNIDDNDKNDELNNYGNFESSNPILFDFNPNSKSKCEQK